MTLHQETLDELWDFSDPVASEAAFRAAISSIGDDEIARAELGTQLARALGLQERYDEADAVLESIDAPSPVVRARVALERGRLKNSAGHPDAALPYFRDGVTVARAAGLTFLAVDGLHMLGIADPDRAVDWTREALDELAGVTDARTLRWHISLNNNLGWTHFDAGALDAAMEAFEAAADAAERYGTEQQKVWAQEAIDECRAAMDEHLAG